MPDADTPFHDQALQLLHALSGAHGIHASLSERANYRAIFTRDAVMAGIAGLLLDDATICHAFVRTLEHLRELQGAAGQIASNYTMQPDRAPTVSFGALAPRIDGTTWYLVGVALAARAGRIDLSHFAASVRRAVGLLDALEYNGRHLMFIPPGGNWADEYPYDGYILYDQVLRAWGLHLLAGEFDEPGWETGSHHIAQTIANNYWPRSDEADVHAPIVRALVDSNRWHPVASFSPTGSWDIFDLAACSLLALSGVTPMLGSATLDNLANRYLASSALPPAFSPVIEEDHPAWPALRRYHLYDFRNRPHEYHNGGIWPIWLGWLALAFGCAGRFDDVQRLRRLVAARLESLPAYQFEEYFHGQTGLPGGTARMAYSATGILFLSIAHDRDRLRLVAP